VGEVEGEREGDSEIFRGYRKRESDGERERGRWEIKGERGRKR